MNMNYSESTRIRFTAYEAERHRLAPRLWAAFSRAAPRVANIKINMLFFTYNLKTMGLHQPIFTDIR